jgi:hypothetical protein
MFSPHPLVLSDVFSCVGYLVLSDVFSYIGYLVLNDVFNYVGYLVLVANACAFLVC